MLKKIKKRVARYPAFIKAYNYLKLVAETKDLKPKKIRLSFSKNVLYANVHDPRGNGLLRNRGLGQQNIKIFWRKSLATFKPSVAIDVGANYGEVLLDAHYPASVTNILAIEANPFLVEYLEKSVMEHGESDKISIYNNLAADSGEKSTTFYIDKKSSGRSTALKGNFVKEPLEIKVESLRVDDLVSGFSETGPILFKIDVEGFEPFVLRGMTKLLQSDRELIGCIEFNRTSLEKNDINRTEYYNFLNQHFSLGLLQKDGSVQPVSVVSDQVIERYFKNKYQEGDILLFSSENLLQRYVDASIKLEE